MKRRTLLPLAAGALLAGCGFQLRQAPDFAFDSIAIRASSTSPLANELRRNLRASEKVQVVDADAAGAAPQVVFELLQELREKVVVGLNASGQVREFQLRERISFRLRTPAGRVLIPPTDLLQERDISFSEAAVLAKEAEESLLYRDMQTDLVQQVMRRLAALKAL